MISKSPLEELLAGELDVLDVEAAEEDEEDDEDEEDAEEPRVVDPALTGFPTAALTAVTVPAIGEVNVASLKLSLAEESVTLAPSMLASSASIVGPSPCLSSATVVFAVAMSCSSFWRVTWALASVCCAVVMAWVAEVTAWAFLTSVACNESWSTWIACWSEVIVSESVAESEVAFA
jgi:hypothetical protein